MISKGKNLIDLHSHHGAALVAVLVGLVVCSWIAYEPLIRGAASLWIVSDPITRADAIVVLGGNFHVRPLIAADLYRRGIANKVLISKTLDDVPARLTPSDTDLNRAALIDAGVPAGIIETFGIKNSNTRDEAVALREWASQNGAAKFMIPTEILSARRVRWIFTREFSGSGVAIGVPSFEPPGFMRNDWWKTEQGVATFQNELSKYVYYRLKY